MSSQAAKEIAEYNLLPHAFIAVPLILAILAAVAVLLRVYVRAFLIRTFGADDWLLLVAFAVFVGDCSLFIAMGVIEQTQGLTGPLETLSGYQLIGMLIYLVDQIILKCSIALFFLRIVQERWQKVVIYVSMGLYASYEIATCFVALFQCGPPSAVAVLVGPSCLNWPHVFGPINYVAGALNAIVDWIFVLMPIMTINRGTMLPIRTKQSASLLIALGALGSVLSIVRIPLLGELEVADTLDYFGGIIPLTLTSLAETGIGIIAISLATLRPLLERVSGTKSSNSSHGPTIPSARVDTLKLLQERDVLEMQYGEADFGVEMPDLNIRPEPVNSRKSWRNSWLATPGRVAFHTEIGANGKERK